MATDLQTKLDERKTAISEAKAARREEYLQDYFALVARVANNDETDPSETIDVLFNADKTENDLHRDAGIYRQRSELFQTWRQLADREKAEADVERRLAEKRDEYERVAGRLKAELSAIGTELVEARRLVGCSRGSERELVGLAWPHTVEKERRVMRQLSDLQTVRVGIEDSIRTSQTTLTTAERLANAEGAPPAQKKHNGEVAAFQRKDIARLKKQMAEVNRQAAELDEQLRAVHQEKLQP